MAATTLNSLRAVEINVVVQEMWRYRRTQLEFEA
jgi:hypothetical protein